MCSRSHRGATRPELTAAAHEGRVIATGREGAREWPAVLRLPVRLSRRHHLRHRATPATGPRSVPFDGVRSAFPALEPLLAHRSRSRRRPDRAPLRPLNACGEASAVRTARRAVGGEGIEGARGPPARCRWCRTPNCSPAACRSLTSGSHAGPAASSRNPRGAPPDPVAARARPLRSFPPRGRFGECGWSSRGTWRGDSAAARADRAHEQVSTLSAPASASRDGLSGIRRCGEWLNRNPNVTPIGLLNQEGSRHGG